MKVKKEYIVLILIIIGLSAYLLMRTSGRTLYQLPELAGLKQGEITKIEISQGGNSFRITVKAWQQATLKRNFDIGKAASSFRHTFVRLDGDSRVFHARDNFRDKFDFTIDDLRDKTVMSFKTTDIRQIEIVKDADSVKLVRSEVPVTPAAAQQQKTEAAPAAALKVQWQNEDGEKVNDPSLKQLLTTLGDLKCSDYINGRSKDEFSAPIYTVKLKGLRDHQLEIFARLETDDKKYPARSSGSAYPFWLSDNKAQQIMKDPSEFLKKDEKKK
ncbi:MAG: DUF4340 domain-containing protein [Desulfobacterales bacterium]